MPRRSSDSPAQVRVLVDRSVRRWRWRRVEAKCPSLRQADGGYGAHTYPLFRLINSRKLTSCDWSHEHVGALCSAMANRQWTQCRLAGAGFVPPHCKACRLCVAHGLCDSECTDPKFLGTLVHRIWTCPAAEPQRQKLVPSALLRRVASLIGHDYTLPPSEVLFYTRALHKSLEPSVSKPPEQEEFVWHVPPPCEGVVQGRVYADGSRLYAEHKYCGLVARQGWAFVIMSDQGKIVASPLLGGLRAYMLLNSGPCLMLPKRPFLAAHWSSIARPFRLVPIMGLPGRVPLVGALGEHGLPFRMCLRIILVAFYGCLRIVVILQSAMRALVIVFF